MSDIDWSKAPEGATHCDPAICCWYMRSNTGWLYFDRGIWSVSYIDHRIVDPCTVGLIARPIEWKGPQDGLPPVGMEVDCYRSGSDWLRGTVVAYVQGAYGKRAIFQGDIDEWWSGAEGDFRPIETERDKAIAEMAGEITLCLTGSEEIVTYTCAKLYDAGYRKETTPCSMK
jgi:hypothetical protein